MLRRSQSQPTVLPLREIEAQFCIPEDGKRLRPPALWHLLALYNRCAAQYRSRLRRCMLLMAVTYSCSVVDALNGAKYTFVSMAVSCCLVAAYIFLRYSSWSNRPVADAIRPLSRVRLSTADIKPLIAMLEYCNGLPVRYDLARLLDGLQLSRSVALADWERWYLRACLERAIKHRNERVAIAALDALRRNGVTAALPRVRRVAKWAEELSVREAAIGCLQALALQAEQAKTGSTLLRATGAPEVSCDALLRPAVDTADC